MFNGIVWLVGSGFIFLLLLPFFSGKQSNAKRKVYPQRTYDPDTVDPAIFTERYNVLWKSSNFRGHHPEMLATAALWTKADRNTLYLGAELFDRHYECVRTQAPPTHEKPDVAYAVQRRLAIVGLPLALVVGGFVADFPYAWLLIFVAWWWFGKLRKSCDAAVREANNIAMHNNEYESYLNTVARGLGIQGKQVSGALVANLHKGWIEARRAELAAKRARANPLRYAAFGTASTEEDDSPTRSSVTSAGTYGYDDSFDDSHYDSGSSWSDSAYPQFNTNGMPMISGTMLDVTGHVYGDV